MAATISTVGPGKDFATLQAWEDWADGQISKQQYAECYSGADLGEVYINGWGGGHVEDDTPWIYAAIGEEHDGNPNNTTQGARIEASGVTHYAIRAWPYVHWLRIERMRINADCTDGGIVAIDLILCNDTLTDGNLIAITNAGANYNTSIYQNPYNDGGLICRNNIVVMDETGTSINQIGIKAYPTASVAFGTANMTTTVYNNTVIGIPTATSHADGIRMDSYSFADTTLNVTHTLRNNLVVEQTVGAAGKTYQPGGAGPGIRNITYDVQYCLSTDTYADTWGGTGNIVDATPSETIADIVNLTDIGLAVGSSGAESGIDLSSDFMTDALNKIRMGDWSMGALDYQTDPSGIYGIVNKIPVQRDPERWLVGRKMELSTGACTPEYSQYSLGSPYSKIHIRFLLDPDNFASGSSDTTSKDVMLVTGLDNDGLERFYITYNSSGRIYLIYTDADGNYATIFADMNISARRALEIKISTTACAIYVDGTREANVSGAFADLSIKFVRMGSIRKCFSAKNTIYLNGFVIDLNGIGVTPFAT
jgi:hypothetical protein